MITIPYSVEGEIIEVSGIYQTNIRYTCKCIINNNVITIPNVEDATGLGGISDYTRRRARSRKDAEYKNNERSQENDNASVGDRVVISFLGGSVLKPVITGYLQHPNQTDEFVEENKENISLVSQYNGIRATIDKDGQLRVVHKGAPKVKYSKKASGLLGKALGTVTSVASSISEKIIGKKNQAVSDPEEDDITLFEMLKRGIFRVRDSKGGMFELDHNKDRVYISDNDLKSTEDPDGGPMSGGLQNLSNSTDAEYVLLDRAKEMVLINARKIIQLYSFGDRKDVTDGDHTHKIKGSDTVSVIGDSTIDAMGDITHKTKAGATLKLSKNKVAVGASGVELLALFDEQMKLLDEILKNIQQIQVLGNLGYATSTPLNTPAFIANQAKLKLINEKLNLIKGSL